MSARLLLLLLLLLSRPVLAQPVLQALAGPDKAWCNGSFGAAADAPVLGDTPAATGGTSPYAYRWTLAFRNKLTGKQETPSPDIYLDDPAKAQPGFQITPYADSLWAILHVTDATGLTASDSMQVRIQWIFCLAESEAVPKGLGDTIMLWPYSECRSNYPACNTYRWSPGTGLSDTTVSHPRCFTNVDRNYVVRMRDGIGCPIQGGITVYIRSLGIGAETEKQPAQVAVEAGGQALRVTAEARATFALFDHLGRLLLSSVISGSGARLPMPAGLPGGLYLWRLSAAGRKEAWGKVLLAQ